MSRRFRTSLGFAAVLALLAALAASAGVVVDETQFVLITDFGRIVSVLGDEAGESGLHLKWPWQMVQRLDRRLQVFDPPAREMITHDKKNLEVAGFVVWRVSDPVRFLRGAGSLELAQARLEERISAALSDSLGRRPLSALASTDASAWQLDAVTREVLDTVAPRAGDELGVSVVDVRLRRFGPPLEVRPAIFDLIRSERRQVASSLRAEGDAQYLALTSQADRDRDAILAQADAEVERIRGQADAEATRLSNDAHSRDPRFFEFLRTLESYRAILDDKATVVLSSSSPLLRLLAHGPPDDLLHEKESPAPRPGSAPSEAKP